MNLLFNDSYYLIVDSMLDACLKGCYKMTLVGCKTLVQFVKRETNKIFEPLFLI